MRPSSTFRSIPSSATVAPNVLRRPRASIHAMVSALLALVCHGPAAGPRSEQFLRREPQALDRRQDCGPLSGEKFFTLTLQQQTARAGVDEHAAPAFFFDQQLVDQLLVRLQYR